MKLLVALLTVLVSHIATGQHALKSFKNNKEFDWVVDSSLMQLTIYYKKDGWAADRIASIKPKLVDQIKSTEQFMGIDSYTKDINYFIVDSRSEMVDLTGRETNGSAFYKDNAITGIASKTIKSIYTNHELFHLMAMNLWGVPELWLNEGMAVYSDNSLNGYDLYALTNYLVNTNKYVPLKETITNFRKVDSWISYPLIGSFVKYLDETYGRELLLKVWKGKRKTIEKLTHKGINELETDWLNTIKNVGNKGITNY